MANTPLGNEGGKILNYLCLSITDNQISLWDQGKSLTDYNWNQLLSLV